MKSPAFAYARPASIEEALELLASNDDAKILSGGQSLLPVMALRLGSPELLVDISQLEVLRGITLDRDGALIIGALATHAEVEDSSLVATYAPLFHLAAPYIGHRAIRNRGTAVGSIAHGDPAAELPAVCLATDATMVAVSSTERREIPAADFFTGFLDTALRDEEILLGVRIPAVPPGSVHAVAEVARRHGDYALVGAVTQLTLDADGVITRAALAFLGAASTPVRVAEAEALLIGQNPSPDLFASAAAVVSRSLDPAADVHASANYRKHLAGVLTKRVLASALDQATLENGARS